MQYTTRHKTKLPPAYVLNASKRIHCTTGIRPTLNPHMRINAETDSEQCPNLPVVSPHRSPNAGPAARPAPTRSASKRSHRLDGPTVTRTGPASTGDAVRPRERRAAASPPNAPSRTDHRSSPQSCGPALTSLVRHHLPHRPLPRDWPAPDLGPGRRAGAQGRARATSVCRLWCSRRV